MSASLPRVRTASALILLALLASFTALLARPNRYGHSDREERHLFPAVSTGPLDPAWSPDGRWIAFSMRGDIWKVPAEGGEAVQLTTGPDYHFEPAWSPDGQRIALSMDVAGNLEIGIVGAEGGEVQRVASHARVDLEPAWSRDGASLYFVSARAGGFRIHRHDFASGRDTSLVSGIQPSVSPDGRSLAYEQNGLRVMDLATMETRLVRAEESEYRMKPVWTPDGRSLLYVTEDKGSNDIRVIAASGGGPIELTIDEEHHEMSPTVSPDGRRFAFVSFDAAVPKLYTADITGGRPSSWREVRITSRRAAKPTGRVRVRVLGPDGRPMPSRVSVLASDGRGYSPDGAFHRAMMVFEHPYFHTGGEAEIEVPAGRTTIEALRGWEYRPGTATVDVAAGGVQTVTLTLQRLMDLPAAGWYSGDAHLHDLHQGFGLTHEAFFLQLTAEDIHVAFPLIHMDGTRLMGRWSDLTGRPHPLSTPTHIVQYSQEFRGGLGHIGMIGTREFILPFVGGQGGTAYAQPELDHTYVERAHAQGGLAGYMHPYLTNARTPGAAASTLIALDAALGLGDYYDVGALYSDEVGSSELYAKLLNAGFRIPATGGTDQFSDVWRDPPPGSARTFAHVEGALSVQSWMEAVKRGRTFMSTGPLLTLDVAGREPGEEIALAANAPATLRVKAEALAIAPLDSLQILVNGVAVRTVAASAAGPTAATQGARAASAQSAAPGRQGAGGSPARITFDGEIPVPEGGWVAARVLGPASRFYGDDYAFAQTSAVYVVRGGRRYVNSADVTFLSQTVDAIWTRVERSTWRSDAERARFKAAVDSAKAVYARLLTEAGGR